MKELNLYEILKGHENETFYCLICGDSKISINEDAENGVPITVSTNTFTINLDKFGRLLNNGECLLFPSKEQRDWNKWLDEQKPKTWSDLEKCNLMDTVPEVGRCFTKNGVYIRREHLNSIEKSALALLKIYQLIEIGYSCNIKIFNRY